MSRELAEIGRQGQPIDLLAGGDVDPATGRLLSIAQLQAALRASTRAPAQRRLPSYLQPAPRSAASGDDPARVPAAREPIEEPPRTPTAAAGADTERGWLLVLAAHPGAGCSTTALAIADAVGAGQPAVHLVEAGHGGHGGLSAVTRHELGVVASGWRRGRRGPVTLDRPDGTGEQTSPPAPLTPGPSEPAAVTILDAGAGWADLVSPPGMRWWPHRAGPAGIVVVCRASVPGLGAAERVLSYLEQPSGTDGSLTPGPSLRVALACLGGTRWRGPVRAACGPRLHQLQEQQLIVGVPHLRRLEASGPTADPLPRSLLSAGQRLWVLAGTSILTEGGLW
jgi:hypothetical protein